MLEAGKNAFTEEHLAAMRTRPWLGELSRHFQNGIDVAGFTAITLDAVIDQAMANEAVVLNGVVHDLLEKLRPHLPPHIKATFPTLEAQTSNPDLNEARDEAFRLRLADAETHPHTGRIWLYIRQTGILRAWASLEALAEDLWVQSLNRAGTQFRQRGFAKVSGNLGKKQIDLGQLAQHDFDLREKLGSVLLSDVSFGKVDGIEKAFKIAFGWDKHYPPPCFTDAKALRAVEAKRHVIAHRGGIIDAEYAEKASLSPSHIGQPLRLDAEAVINDISVVTVQGAQLLGQTAIWLQTVDPIEHPPT